MDEAQERAGNPYPPASPADESQRIHHNPTFIPQDQSSAAPAVQQPVMTAAPTYGSDGLPSNDYINSYSVGAGYNSAYNAYTLHPENKQPANYANAWYKNEAYN